MAWAATMIAFVIDGIAVSVDAGGAAAVAAVWASTILSAVSIIVYAASRSVLDKLLIEAAKLAGERL